MIVLVDRFSPRMLSGQPASKIQRLLIWERFSAPHYYLGNLKPSPLFKSLCHICLYVWSRHDDRHQALRRCTHPLSRSRGVVIALLQLFWSCQDWEKAEARVYLCLSLNIPMVVSRQFLSFGWVVFVRSLMLYTIMTFLPSCPCFCFNPSKVHFWLMKGKYHCLVRIILHISTFVCDVWLVSFYPEDKWRVCTTTDGRLVENNNFLSCSIESAIGTCMNSNSNINNKVIAPLNRVKRFGIAFRSRRWYLDN